MTNKIRDFIDELRNRWDDSYWWADHQWLMYILLCSILFVYELSTTYFKLRMKVRMTAIGE